MKEILDHLGINFKFEVTNLKINKIELIEILVSGYQEMSFDEKRLISKIDDYERAECLLNLIPPLTLLYKQHSYPVSLLYESLTDLALRLNKYWEKEHCLGLTADDGHWLIRLFFLKIFKIGSLQYEHLTLDFNKLDYSLNWKESVYKDSLQGQAVISIHIMEKTDLSIAAVKESFSHAMLFFDGFTFDYFYCCSWLLNPDNKYLLNKNSRIIKFSNLFKIVATSKYKKHAIFSIFEGDINKVARSSLQIKAQKAPDYLGIGVGIIPHP
ncbi:hypothetical protein [Facklamia lactis]|nr:hypothetical protein [Facklamia lactis]